MAEDRFEQVWNQYKKEGEQAAIEKIQSSGDAGKEQIVAVRKNEGGDIIAFQTSSGRTLDYVQALEEAKNGNIAHLDVFHKYGRDIIRSEPDGLQSNNLDSLPEF